MEEGYKRGLLDQILFDFSGISITIGHLVELLLISYLLYRLYKLAKGTAAINIFFGLIVIYLSFLVVSGLRLKYLSQLLGGFVGGGVIVIVILFQQEIRRYLSLLGTRDIIKNEQFLKLFNSNKETILNIPSLIKSCVSFSESNTGALIVLTKGDDLSNITETAVRINAEISFPLISSIFYKNSPLHDGAIIIRNNKIVAARCILPTTNDDSFPKELGMRHRAAVGISEHSDAVTIVISEQNSKIAYTNGGKIQQDVSIKELEKFIASEFNEK